MKILVGLGNPGEKYEENRHNVGFMAVAAIAENHGGGAWKRRFQGLTTEIDVGREKCLLLKPTTFMNESGRSIGEAMRFFKVSPADVIVFHDELDLEPGRIRVKFGGGHAGHNGLKSISAHIGNDYHRVRIGIGHPGSREAVVSYVLHDFSKKDREWLEPLLNAVASGVPHLIAGQDAKFLNEIARVNRAAPEPAAPARKDERPAASPAAELAATNGAPVPPPAAQTPERKSQPAYAATASTTQPGESETSLAAKLRAWFTRR
jgi:peptidyl-tRNA hydrolase, PTH1 family